MLAIISSLSPALQIWFVLLFIVWALFLFGGFLFGRPDAENKRRMPRWTRIASSATLVVIAWSWYGIGWRSEVWYYALMIAVGMSLGLLGDLYMAELIGSGQRLISGMAAFGMGHVAYIYAMLRLGNQQSLDAPLIRWMSLVIWLMVGAVGWRALIYRHNEATGMHKAALVYALLLASTAGLANGLALQAFLFFPLAVGAVLFLVSDLILAAELFNDLKFPLIGDAVWLTYGPGQMFIVYSVGAALLFSATT